MVEANRNIAPKRWVLLGEYFQQLLDEGLSPHAAEQAIRREGQQQQFDYRCRSEAGRQVNAPANLWIAGSFDFATSWATVPRIPDPLAPLIAEAARRVRSVEASVERALGLRGVAQKEDSSSREILRRPDSRRLFVEVFVEARSVAPIQEQADTERNTGVEVDPFRTGTQGRPPASHHVVHEFEQRLQADVVKPKRGELNKCARDLHDWWEEARNTFNPPGPPLSVPTIENAIRERWRQALDAARINPRNNPRN
jgi:hypothetical protein